MKKKVVKFTKENCPHCKIFEPIFKREIEKFRNQIDFYEISLDDHPFFKEIFNIRGVPALYSFSSEDFESFTDINQLVIGHSHEGYPLIGESLSNLIHHDEEHRAL